MVEEGLAVEENIYLKWETRWFGPWLLLRTLGELVKFRIRPILITLLVQTP